MKLVNKIKKYFSLPTSHFSPQKGYTLIELLTVIGILSVIGGIVLSVVTISLQGTKKSDTLEVVRQNGDTALSQMVRTIRYARDLNSPTSCTPSKTVSSITVTSLRDNAQTVLSCGADTISSNSASLINTSAVATTSCSFTCTQERPTDSPTITIEYTLSAKSAGTFQESKASIPFQSSVTMRNYTR